MSAAATLGASIRPLPLRLADRLALGPRALGLWVLAGLLLTVTLVAVFGGDFDAPASPFAQQDLRVAVVLALILAYTAGAQRFAAARAERTLVELAPVLDLEPEGEAAWNRRVGQVDARRHRHMILGTLVGLFLLAFLPEAVAYGEIDLQLVGPLAILHRILVAAIGAFAGSTATTMISASRLLSRLSEERGRLDLFDTTAWRPLARLGLVNAFFGAGLISLLLLLLPDLDAGVGLAVLLLGLVVGLALLASQGLLLPLRGIHRRIRSEKRTQLQAYRRELRELMDERPTTRDAPGRLADLAAYGRLLEEVAEWPLDLPQMGRFALLFGLPVASWIAAALVERLLDGILG